MKEKRRGGSIRSPFPGRQTMDLDAKVCYCFHVSQRKLVNFIRRRRPKVPSQLADCGGAGTGCGWCIPFLKQMHQQAVKGGTIDLEQITPEEYERRRAVYVRAGKGTPPIGATPLPAEENG
jgi:bacterioferritin-associated ferredoxin